MKPSICKVCLVLLGQLLLTAHGEIWYQVQGQVFGPFAEQQMLSWWQGGHFGSEGVYVSTSPTFQSALPISAFFGTYNEPQQPQQQQLRSMNGNRNVILYDSSSDFAPPPPATQRLVSALIGFKNVAFDKLGELKDKVQKGTEIVTKVVQSRQRRWQSTTSNSGNPWDEYDQYGNVIPNGEPKEGDFEEPIAPVQDDYRPFQHQHQHMQPQLPPAPSAVAKQHQESPHRDHQKQHQQQAEDTFHFDDLGFELHGDNKPQPRDLEPHRQSPEPPLSSTTGIPASTEPDNHEPSTAQLLHVPERYSPEEEAFLQSASPSAGSTFSSPVVSSLGTNQSPTATLWGSADSSYRGASTSTSTSDNNRVFGGGYDDDSNGAGWHGGGGGGGDWGVKSAAKALGRTLGSGLKVLSGLARPRRSTGISYTDDEWASPSERRVLSGNRALENRGLSLVPPPTPRSTPVALAVSLSLALAAVIASILRDAALGAAVILLMTQLGQRGVQIVATDGALALATGVRDWESAISALQGMVSALIAQPVTLMLSGSLVAFAVLDGVTLPALRRASSIRYQPRGAAVRSAYPTTESGTRPLFLALPLISTLLNALRLLLAAQVSLIAFSPESSPRLALALPGIVGAALAMVELAVLLFWRAADSRSHKDTPRGAGAAQRLPSQQYTSAAKPPLNGMRRAAWTVALGLAQGLGVGMFLAAWHESPRLLQLVPSSAFCQSIGDGGVVPIWRMARRAARALGDDLVCEGAGIGIGIKLAIALFSLLAPLPMWLQVLHESSGLFSS